MEQLKQTEPETTTGDLRPMTFGLAVTTCAAAVVFRVLPALLAKASIGVFLPFLWHLTPLGALSMFGGARLRLWQALALPLTGMVVTDLTLWLVKGDRPFDPFVYTSYAIYVLIGRLLQQTESPLKIAGGGLAGCASFFVLTNLGYWLEGYNGYTFAGLVRTYVDAIPFATGTVLGDLIYIPLLFGAHALLARTVFPAERVRPLTVTTAEPVEIA